MICGNASFLFLVTIDIAHMYGCSRIVAGLCGVRGGTLGTMQALLITRSYIYTHVLHT